MRVINLGGLAWWGERGGRIIGIISSSWNPQQTPPPRLLFISHYPMLNAFVLPISKNLNLVTQVDDQGVGVGGNDWQPVALMLDLKSKYIARVEVGKAANIRMTSKAQGESRILVHMACKHLGLSYVL